MRDTPSGDLALWEVPASDLIDDVASGPKLQYARDFDVTVLDADDEVASVRILSQPFNEYLHLAVSATAGWLSTPSTGVG